MKQKHTKHTQINTNKSMHSERGPVWQNPIQSTIKRYYTAKHDGEGTLYIWQFHKTEPN